MNSRQIYDNKMNFSFLEIFRVVEIDVQEVVSKLRKTDKSVFKEYIKNFNCGSDYIICLIIASLDSIRNLNLREISPLLLIC